MYESLYNFCFDITSNELKFGFYDYNNEEKYNIHEIYVVTPQLIN